MAQNLFPERLRYPHTRQTMPLESFVISSAVSPAACSASASAARRCAASSAAARASGLGLGRRISGCTPRNKSSSSDPLTCESEGNPEGRGFLLSSSTNPFPQCWGHSSPAVPTSAIGWKTRFSLPSPSAPRCRSPDDISRSVPFAEHGDRRRGLRSRE